MSDTRAPTRANTHPMGFTVLLRLGVCSMLVILVGAGCGFHGSNPPPDIGYANAFSVAANITLPRAGHSAALAKNGRVLLIGGTKQANLRAEISDSTLTQFTQIPDTEYVLGELLALPDRRVLVLGGGAFQIFDSATFAFTALAPYPFLQSNAPVALMNDGRVAICGGVTNPSYHYYEATTRCEILDPATQTFSEGGKLLEPRDQSTAVTLLNGKILFVGGTTTCPFSTDPMYPIHCDPIEVIGNPEQYDPGTGTSAIVGAVQPRYQHTATALNDGKVLIVGGVTMTGPLTSPWYLLPPLATAELYDPATGQTISLPGMSEPRILHTATLLSDGRVLIAGGVNNYAQVGEDHFPTISTTAEIFDPATNTFSAPVTMTKARARHAATRLEDGRVLITGGVTRDPTSPLSYGVFTESTEIFH